MENVDGGQRGSTFMGSEKSKEGSTVDQTVSDKNTSEVCQFFLIIFINHFFQLLFIRGNYSPYLYSHDIFIHTNSV